MKLAWLAVGALATIAVLRHTGRLGGSSAPQTEGTTVPPAIPVSSIPTLAQSRPSVDWAMSPESVETYWRIMGRGSNPSMFTAGDPAGRGSVSPQISTLAPGGSLQRSTLPRAVPWLMAWWAPRAGDRGPGTVAPIKPGGPAGVASIPQPVAPATPTPQSAVRPSSPWLPRLFAFAQPYSDSRWLQPAYALSPWAPTYYAGGFFATRTVPTLGPERA